MLDGKKGNNMDGEIVSIITCLLHGKEQVRFKCIWCNHYHIHGCDPDLRKGKKSHRCSHCGQHREGYYLKLPSKADIKDTLLYGYK